MDKITGKILTEYEDLRSKNETKRQLTVKEVYKNYPQLKEIDSKICTMGAENVKRIMKNPQNADEFNKEYKSELKKMKKERDEFIKQNKIDPLFDKIKYGCEICKDTGFTEDRKKCRCFERKLIDVRYKKSNIGDVLENENFDSFSFDYYSKEKKDGYELSPYENMVKIHRRAVNFCENFDTEDKGLLFYGNVGLGKTFLSSCITKKLIDMGKTVVYIRASKLFSIYEDYKFGRMSDREKIDDLYACDLLIIDDLGTETKSQNNISFLFDLLNDRLDGKKKIIINTNYNMNEIAKVYSKRLTSRIYQHFIIYNFYGEDIRVKKLFE